MGRGHEAVAAISPEEELALGLQAVVANFWKAEGLNSVDPKEVLRLQARKIISLHRAAQNMRTAFRWVEERKMQKPREDGNPKKGGPREEKEAEVDDERRWQLKDDFWALYRSGQQTRDMPVKKMQEKDGYSPFVLDTHSQFWQLADNNSSASKKKKTTTKACENKQRRGVPSWAGRCARDTRQFPQRWNFGKHVGSEPNLIREEPRKSLGAHLPRLVPAESPPPVAHSKHLGVATKVATSMPDLLVERPSNYVSLPSISEKRKTSRQGLPPGRTAPGEANLDAETETIVERSSRRQQARDTPMARYLKACTRIGILPLPMDFVTGYSLKLHAGEQGLTDADLKAVAAMVRSMDRIDEVDLHNNTKLTDSLVPFLTKLFGKPAGPSLLRLSLSRCSGAGTAALDIVEELLTSDNGLKNLRSLDLGGIQMAMKPCQAICSAVQAHPFLEEAHLAQIGMGDSPACSACVDYLLGSTLRTLDLSWNCFSADNFERMGMRLVETQLLQTLKVANCSSSTGSLENAPVCHFVQYLSHDKTLTSLDLSLNQLSYRGAFVLEDALVDHPRLRTLDMKDNPLGAFGMRSMARLFTMCMPLSQLDSSDCFKVTGDERREEQLFHMTDPAGSYTLDLSQPYGRAVLRLLYKTCSRLGVSLQQAFGVQNANSGSLLDGKKFVPPAKTDADGVWPVPTTGVLKALFNPGLADEVQLEDEDFVEPVIERYCNRVRLKPHFVKIGQLLKIFNTLSHREQEQLSLLDMLAKDFSLTYPHMHQFCQSRDIASAAICRLIPCVQGGQTVRYLCTLFAPSASENRANHKRLRKFVTLTAENPTGYYRLQLDNAADYAVAERLLLLSRWEAMASVRQGMIDASKHGDRSRLRNLRHEQRLVRMGRMGVPWQLPESGVFEFDYVSGRRPPGDAVPLSDAAFTDWLAALCNSESSTQEKFFAMKSCAANMFLTCEQLRKLLVRIDIHSVRHDIFIMFIFRLVDIHNEKLCRAKFTQAEVAALLNRLGHTTFFPFIQVEQVKFELDFAMHDQRMAAFILLNLHEKEQGELRHASYVREDGTLDKFPHGVPRSWHILEKVPAGGVARFDYLAAFSCMNFPYRHSLLETYGRWKAKKERSEVTWWRGLTETPDDVVLFAICTKRMFPSIDVAFQAFLKDEKLKTLNWNSFLAAMQEMHWKWFHLPEAKKRLHKIFDMLAVWKKTREVTLEEFRVLGQVCDEMELQLREFKEFAGWRFGGHVDQLWSFVDAQKLGRISSEQWQTEMNNAGYFGDATLLIRLATDGCREYLAKEVVEALLHAGHHHRPGVLASNRRSADGTDTLPSPLDTILSLAHVPAAPSTHRSHSGSKSSPPSKCASEVD